MEPLPRSRRKLLGDRERNLCKKADELSILCDTDVCMIIFKPHKTEPETWPRERKEVHRIIEKYKPKLAMKNNDVKDMSIHSFQAIGDATNATSSHSTSASHEPNEKIKLDLNFSDSYDSVEARNTEMQYQRRSAKHPESGLIGDDEAMLASLETKLQAINKRIASREANYFQTL